MALPARVSLVEVGPRDGLQNEAAEIATDDKIAFAESLGTGQGSTFTLLLPEIVSSAPTRADAIATMKRSGSRRYTSASRRL